MSLIAMVHEDHGTHIVYSDQERKICEENGWKSDPALSRILAGEAVELVEKSLVDKYKDKFGKPPHHLMKKANIEKALAD